MVHILKNEEKQKVIKAYFGEIKIMEEAFDNPEIEWASITHRVNAKRKNKLKIAERYLSDYPILKSFFLLPAFTVKHLKEYLLFDKKTHNLKTFHNHFVDVISGNKKAEIRINDRNFKKGDYLNLQEFHLGNYTGNEHKVIITHVLDGGLYGIKKNYVVLSINNVTSDEV
ncbi:MAG: hypothetical protein COA59_05990 [Colwellia sp.]|nr:MAG: hypothetical protein COA59_05990 [Colwellia sp.]